MPPQFLFRVHADVDRGAVALDQKSLGQRPGDRLSADHVRDGEGVGAASDAEPPFKEEGVYLRINRRELFTELMDTAVARIPMLL